MRCLKSPLILIFEYFFSFMLIKKLIILGKIKSESELPPAFELHPKRIRRCTIHEESNRINSSVSISFHPKTFELQFFAKRELRLPYRVPASQVPQPTFFLVWKSDQVHSPNFKTHVPSILHIASVHISHTFLQQFPGQKECQCRQPVYQCTSV